MAYERNPSLYDDDITQAADGSFTVSFAPWHDELIEGIPTLELARRICHAAHAAMRRYADDAMIED